MPTFRHMIPLALTALLAACGGSTDSATKMQAAAPGIFPLSGTSTLTVAAVNRNTRVANDQTTQITQAGVLSAGILRGTLQNAGTGDPSTFISLTGGGTASVNNQAGGNAFLFSTSDYFGVAGLASSSIPSSSTATYAGTAGVFVNDGVDVRNLTRMTATAAFGSGLVDVVLTGGGRTLRIDNATISGTGFSGGIPSSSGFATSPDGSNFTHNGQFYSDDGAELGGAFVIDNATSTGFTAGGAYLGR